MEKEEKKKDSELQLKQTKNVCLKNSEPPPVLATFFPPKFFVTRDTIFSPAAIIHPSKKTKHVVPVKKLARR